MVPRNRSAIVSVSPASMKLNVINLYTGAGALDLGLEAEGLDPIAFVETDGETVEALHANRGAWPVSLAKVQVELLTRGLLCQPFSNALYWRDRYSERPSEALEQFGPEVITGGASDK